MKSAFWVVPGIKCNVHLHERPEPLLWIKPIILIWSIIECQYYGLIPPLTDFKDLKDLQMERFVTKCLMGNLYCRKKWQNSEFVNLSRNQNIHCNKRQKIILENPNRVKTTVEEQFLLTLLCLTFSQSASFLDRLLPPLHTKKYIFIQQQILPIV